MIKRAQPLLLPTSNPNPRRTRRLSSAAAPDRNRLAMAIGNYAAAASISDAATYAPDTAQRTFHMPARARPLSPHLDVYRWQIANTLSIVHRLTGVMLSVGLLALTAWLVALAGGPERYRAVMRILESPLGAAALAAFGFGFFYHLLNGIRHLFWDIGYGFGSRERHLSGWLVVAGALVLTACALAFSIHFSH